MRWKRTRKQPFRPDVSAAAANITEHRIKGDRAVVAHPLQRSCGSVAYFHGTSATERTPFTERPKSDLTAGLLAAGFTVGCCHAGGDSWGNPAAQRSALHLLNILTKPLIFVGESMGGFLGLAMLNHVRPAAWVGICPVTDLQSVVPTFKGSIGSAWQGPVPEPPYDPGRVKGLPMLFVITEADPVVPVERNALASVTELRGHGAEVKIATAEGGHCSVDALAPDRVVAFLNGYAGGSSCS